MSSKNIFSSSIKNWSKNINWGDNLDSALRRNSPHINSAINWYYLTDVNSSPKFAKIYNFLQKHHSWPKENKLRFKAEKALMNEGCSLQNFCQRHADIWFSKYKPISKWGQLLYAEINEKVNKQLARNVWINGDFNLIEEKRILTKYSKFLDKNTHYRRANRLLWEGHISAAKRVIPYITRDKQKLLNARIFLISKKSGITKAINKVPKYLKKDAGLMYDRLLYKAKRKDYEGVLNILLSSPKNPPYANKWWKYRKLQIRRAIENKKYNLAEKLLKNHNLDYSMKTELADALWLKGWLELEFLNKPQEAFKAFNKMYNLVSYPISKARGAYWAGRASAKLKMPSTAEKWYKKAAIYPYVFYGQLALNELGEDKISIKTKYIIDNFVNIYKNRGNIRKTSLYKTVLALAHIKMLDKAMPFLKHLIKQSDNYADILHITEIGIRMGRPDISLKIAKEALKKGIFIRRYLYPKNNLLRNSPVEKEFALAIMRQESMFDINAKSSAGAVGLMQIMPSTAKYIANKNDIPYKKTSLNSASYNVNIGTIYLANLLQEFDGSIAGAAAAYNAGASRPHKWEQDFGETSDNLHRNINLIEIIPFSETRNYVMRILENYQTYKAIFAGGKSDLILKKKIAKINNNKEFKQLTTSYSPFKKQR